MELAKLARNEIFFEYGLFHLKVIVSITVRHYFTRITNLNASGSDMWVQKKYNLIFAYFIM